MFKVYLLYRCIAGFFSYYNSIWQPVLPQDNVVVLNWLWWLVVSQLFLTILFYAFCLSFWCWCWCSCLFFPILILDWWFVLFHFLFPPSLDFIQYFFVYSSSPRNFFFFLFLPKAHRYIVVYSSLWVLPVVACGTLPQRGLMSSAMSVPRIRTNKTLCRQHCAACSGVHELNHSATGSAPQGFFLTW